MAEGAANVVTSRLSVSGYLPLAGDVSLISRLVESGKAAQSTPSIDVHHSEEFSMGTQRRRRAGGLMAASSSSETAGNEAVAALAFAGTSK
jgi:hypothetical protein